MGRKKNNFVHHYFHYDGKAGKSKCLTEGCGKLLQGKHASNLLRHFFHNHRADFHAITQRNQLHRNSLPGKIKNGDTSPRGNESMDENDDKPVKHELEPETSHEEEETEEFDDPLKSEDEPGPVNEPPSPPPSKLVRLTPRSEFVRASSSQKTPKHRKMFNEVSSTVKQEKQDQFDVFGMNVASKLRETSIKDNRQRLIAEKIINDALFYAEMGQLTFAHCNKFNPNSSTQ